MSVFALESLDLAALLCSKICHDVISPVGAIANGLEVLDEEEDPDMRAIALDLIRSSAQTASAKLQFCRLAFGASGSVGASIDTGDAEKVTRGLFYDDRTRLEWHGARQLVAKNKVKLLLNLCLIGASAIPRGGILEVTISGEGDETILQVEARSSNVRLASHIASLLESKPEKETIDAHSIQAYYTGLIARASKMQLNVIVEPERLHLMAKPDLSLQELIDEAHRVEVQPEGATPKLDEVKTAPETLKEVTGTDDLSIAS